MSVLAPFWARQRAVNITINKRLSANPKDIKTNYCKIWNWATRNAGRFIAYQSHCHLLQHFSFIVHWFIRNGYSIAMVFSGFVKIQHIAHTHTLQTFRISIQTCLFRKCFLVDFNVKWAYWCALDAMHKIVFQLLMHFNAVIARTMIALSSLAIEIHYSRNCVCISDIQTQIYYYRKSALTNVSRFDLFVFSELQRLFGA